MKRGKFSLSHYKLASCDPGELVPLSIYEALPGDTIQQSTNALLRTQPLLAPIMHPVHVRIHHWFIPYRLIWEDWENFITGGPDGNDSSAMPFIDFTGQAVSEGDLADYLGFPIGYNGQANALPFRAYALVYNEYFRDQDLVTPLAISVAGGTDSTTSVDLQNVAWERDYFTKARPWEQKGPAITIPLGDEAPISGIGVTAAAVASSTISAKDSVETSTWDDYFTNQAQQLLIRSTSGDVPDAYADLSDASAITVTALREALGLQRYEEARARYGSRYTEYLRYLGIRSGDARLQRPEYLGGGNQTIQFSEVLQTAEGTDEVGTMRGHGIAGLRSNRYRRYIEEHGFIMTTLSARPKTVYMDGVPKMYTKTTKEEYWQKELQHIGQQEILNAEVKWDHADATDVFGYTDRYDEYRRIPSSVAGEYRTSVLDYWHMARDFSTDPALNQSFVECVPTTRVWPTAAEDKLYIMARHSIQARRLVSQTSNSYIF